MCYPHRPQDPPYIYIHIYIYMFMFFKCKRNLCDPLSRKYWKVDLHGFKPEALGNISKT